MADYTSNLNIWGSTGEQPPGNYSYEEGEQPVDEWDNYVNYNVERDLNHLIYLTNNRVESDYGDSASFPASPESSHIYYDEEEEALYHYDTDQDDWRQLARTSGDNVDSATTLTGTDVVGADELDLGISPTWTSQHQFNVGIDTRGDISDDTATIWDSSAGYIPQGRLENDSINISTGDGLTGGGVVNLGETVQIGIDLFDQYTDADAISAADSQVDATATTLASLDDATNTHISATNPHSGSASTNHDNSQHSTNYLPEANYDPEGDTHSRYTDGEASAAAPVQSVNGETGNPTFPRPREAWSGTVTTDSNGYATLVSDSELTRGDIYFVSVNAHDGSGETFGMVTYYCWDYQNDDWGLFGSTSPLLDNSFDSTGDPGGIRVQGTNTGLHNTEIYYSVRNTRLTI